MAYLQWSHSLDDDLSVHANLLYSHSNFAVACRDDPKLSCGTGDIMVPTPGENPKFLTIYCHWLYTGHIDFSIAGISAGLDYGDDVDDEEWEAYHTDYTNEVERFVRLHFIGWELGDDGFMNATMDELVKLPNTVTYPTYWEVTEIFERLKFLDTPLMRWLIDATVPFVNDPEREWRYYEDGFPSEFLEAVERRIEERKSIAGAEKWPCWEARCQYHQHEDGDGAVQCIE